MRAGQSDAVTATSERPRRTPVPRWKRSEWAHDVLPHGDPAERPDAEVVHKG
jgi:hypothetical protein